MTGNGFVKASHDAFYLIARNPGLFMATDVLEILIMVVGKLVISFSTSMIGYAIF